MALWGSSIVDFGPLKSTEEKPSPAGNSLRPTEPIRSDSAHTWEGGLEAPEGVLSESGCQKHLVGRSSID